MAGKVAIALHAQAMRTDGHAETRLNESIVAAKEANLADFIRIAASFNSQETRLDPVATTGLQAKGFADAQALRDAAESEASGAGSRHATERLKDAAVLVFLPHMERDAGGVWHDKLELSVQLDCQVPTAILAFGKWSPLFSQLFFSIFHS